MFETQRERGFPLPDYDLSDRGAVKLCLSGRILDERYTRLLMERSDLSPRQVRLLDRVQRRRRIEKTEHRLMKAAGLVEGRYPNLIVASSVARATGEAGRYIRERGLNYKYYRDLIEAFVGEHGPVGRREVDEFLIPKLPDRLTAQQKRTRVSNLLQALRSSGRVANRGPRSKPRWVRVGVRVTGQRRDNSAVG